MLRYRHRSGSGWAWGAGTDERPLYHLQNLRVAPGEVVYICESEKVCDRLAQHNLLATCPASGWSNVDVEPLRKRDVFVLVDADTAGEKKATESTEAICNVARSVRIVRSNGPADGSNLADAIGDGFSVEDFIEACNEAPLYQGAATPLVPIDMRKWEGQPIPPREWSVPERVPLRNVTLFSGHGGIGKSIVGMMLAAAHALGKDWLGSIPEPGPCVFFSTEDDEREMHRRFARIADHHGASIADLRKGGLNLIDRVSSDPVLAWADRNGMVQRTPLLDQLHDLALDIKPKTVIIDCLGDVFAGSENLKQQVRQFLAILRSFAHTANCAVVLVSHPSMTGMNTGSGLSGVMDWHNAVRSRIYMEQSKDNDEDTELRSLKFLKANYARQGDEVAIRYRDGVFVPEPGVGSLEKMASEQVVDGLFLELLTRFEQNGRKVSDKTTANNYAPKSFADTPEAKGGNIRKRDFVSAMERLFKANKIRSDPYGAPCRGWTKLVIT